MTFIPENPKTYKGNQVIINSDRLVFNAKKDSILLFSDKAIGFSTNGSFHFDTSPNEESKFVINSPQIYLGLEYDDTLPTQPAVLGEELKEILTEILELWTHFKAVQMELSIDDIQERNEYIRYPVKWSSTLDFLNWCDNETEDNVYVSMNKTVQNLNIYYVPDMIDWVLEQKFKKINKHNGGIPFHNVCHQPERCNIKVLPQEIKQRIRNKYEEWYKNFKLNYNVNTNDTQIIDNAEYQIHRVMKLLDLMDDVIDDICTKVTYIVTVPGGLTGINPSNFSVFQTRKLEIENLKQDIQDIMSTNTKLV